MYRKAFQNQQDQAALERERSDRNAKFQAFYEEEENQRELFIDEVPKTEIDQVSVDTDCVDDLARSIRKDLRGSNKSIKAIESYRKLKNLSAGEIDYFYKNYTYLWDKVIDNLPKEFIESNEFGFYNDLSGSTSGKPDFDINNIEKTGIIGSGVVGNNLSEFLNPFKKVKEYKINLGKVTKAFGPMGGTTFPTSKSQDLPENISPENIGEVTIQIDKETREINITASSLPIAVNYQASDYNFRLDESVFEGLDFCLGFPEKKQDDQTGAINLNLDRLVLNNMRILAEDYSFSIKKLEIKDIRINATQTLGYKFKLTKSYLAIFTLLDYISLLQNASMLLVSGMGANPDMGEAIDTFKELLTNSSSHNLDLGISMGELAIEGFSYTDKIDGKTEITHLTTANGQDKSSIDLKIKAKGVEESDYSKLYVLKTRLAKEKERLAKLEKRASKGISIFKNRLAKQQTRVKNLSAEIAEIQKNLVFETSANIYGLQTTELGYAKYLNSTLSNFVQSIDGSQNANADHISIKSTIGPESIKDTKITLSNVSFGNLDLSGINYNDNKSLSLKAVKAEMVNVTASLELYLKSASVQSDEGKRSIQATPALVYISDFEAEKISVSGGILSLLEQNLTAYIGLSSPAVLDCLKMIHFYIDLDTEEGEKAIPKAQRELLSLSLDAYRSGKGDKVEMKNDLAQTVLAFSMQDVVAGGITLNMLKEGGIDYEFMSLSGSSQIDVTKYNALGKGNTQTSILNFPGLMSSSKEGEQQPALSGSYRDGKITFKAYLPQLGIQKLDFGDKELSFKSEGENESKLLGVTVEFEYMPEIKPDESTGQKGTAASMNLKKIHVDDTSLYGLQISMFAPGNQETGEKDTLQTVSFPKNSPVTIQGLDLTQFRMEKMLDSKGKLSFQYNPEEGKEAVITTNGVKLPKGLQYQNITEKTTLTLQNGKWDKCSFKLLKNGGIDYSFDNLDALLSLNKKGEQEVNSEIKLNSNIISGSYSSETKLDENGVLRKFIYFKKTKINIPEILINSLNIKSDKLSIIIPKSGGKSAFKNMNGLFDVTLKMPTDQEKITALKAEKKASPMVEIYFHYFHMDQAKLYEAEFTSNKSVIKTIDIDNVPKEYTEKTKTSLKLRKGASAILQELNITGSKLKLNSGTSPFQFSGKVSIGNEKQKGIDIGTSHFLSDMVSKWLEGNELVGYNQTNIASKISAQSVSFSGDTEGEYVITIVSPDVRIPENIGTPYINEKGIHVMTSDEPKGANFSLDVNAAIGKNELFKLFNAKKVEIIREKISDKTSENIEYRNKYRITDPVLSPLKLGSYNTFEFGKKELSILTDFTLYGEVKGVLVISENTIENTPVWVINSVESTIYISSAEASVNLDDLGEYLKMKKDSKDQEDTDIPDPNNFGFLDGASGSVELSMFGISRTQDIEELTIKENNEYRKVAYLDVNSMVTWIAERFNDEVGWGKDASVLDDLLCIPTVSGQYNIYTFPFGYPVEVFRILENTKNNNLIKSEGNLQVRISSMVKTIANKPEEEKKEDDSFTTASKESIDEFLFRKENPMNPKFTMDLSIDLSRVPKEKRGLMSMFSTSKNLSMNLEAGFWKNINHEDDGTTVSYITGDKDIYPTVRISDLVVPPFTTKIGGKDSVTSLSTGGLEIEKITFQYKKHVSPKAGETKRKWGGDNLKMRNIAVKNLNLVLPRKTKK